MWIFQVLVLITDYHSTYSIVLFMAVYLIVEAVVEPDIYSLKLQRVFRRSDCDDVGSSHTPLRVLDHGTSFPALTILAVVSDTPTLARPAEDDNSEANILPREPTAVDSTDGLEFSTRAASPCPFPEELASGRQTVFRDYCPRSIGRTELRLRAMLYSGTLQAVQHIPWPAKFLPCSNTQELKRYVPYRQSMKQAVNGDQRLLSRVRLAGVARPVEFFNGRTELTRIFREYFRGELSHTFSLQLFT